MPIPGVVFRPGESAPASGVYAVTHGSDHRPPHQVTMRKDDLFPACRRCGRLVRFRLLIAEETGRGSG